MRQTFYITTAIDYPNGAPHIGHSLEKVAADVVARYHRLIGDDTAFCMGLDENSQHIVTAATRNGVSPAEWTDQMDTAFQRTWDALDISRDSWVRTTEERHARASVELYARALANGDIYTSTYAGWYCPNCNTYYAEDELVAGRCPLHPNVSPEWLEEENHFFALSKYADRLRDLFETNPDFVTPAAWRPEMMALIDSGLRDFSVSRRVRPGVEPWGIPVPGDPSQVLYVWYDALTTYLTAVGFPDDMERFDRYWPADSQIIGKDITRFHCLYWPAMLMSAGLPLPRRIVVHGFLTLEGKRISTSAGNTIDPVDLVDELGPDPIRYYMLRDVSFTSDGDFSRARLIRRHNDDLGNDLGNLLNRVVSMIGRYRGGVIPEGGKNGEDGKGGRPEVELREVVEAAKARAEASIEAWSLNDALDGIWTAIRRTNQYLEERRPWTLAKQPDQAAELDTTLWSAAEATRIVALLLAPFLPSTADRILAQLGLSAAVDGAWRDQATWGAVALGTVAPAGPLFPRIEDATAD